MSLISLCKSSLELSLVSWSYRVLLQACGLPSPNHKVQGGASLLPIESVDMACWLLTGDNVSCTFC